MKMWTLRSGEPTESNSGEISMLRTSKGCDLEDELRMGIGMFLLVIGCALL